jgi:AcrR family transcriptional regulator
MASDPTTLPPRLPRGPHQLSREDVEQSQRIRILLAITEVVAEKGWTATSVTNIVAHAGVSRSTFYQLFDDRLDCFLAANEVAYGALMAAMSERLAATERAGEVGFSERIGALMSGYIETLVANPGLARVFLVEVYAAGPKAIEQRRRAIDGFVELFLKAMNQGSEFEGGVSEEERILTEVIVAAVSSFATNAAGADDIESLKDMQAPIMAVVGRLEAFRD